MKTCRLLIPDCLKTISYENCSRRYPSAAIAILVDDIKVYHARIL